MQLDGGRLAAQDDRASSVCREPPARRPKRRLVEQDLAGPCHRLDPRRGGDRLAREAKVTVDRDR